MTTPPSLDAAINKVVREEWGRILASITKSISDLQLAEDSLQDAVEAALQAWPNQGLPRSPAAWLIQTARRKAIDRLRRDQNFKGKAAQIKYLKTLEATDSDMEDTDTIPDKRLEMMFTCCHPALTEKTQVALTLRTIGGLTTDEIARSFLDTPKGMAQWLVRAKHKIKTANIPYECPGKDILPERLSGVLSVIYLIFNEGYSANFGQALIRAEFSDEAIRLGRIMVHLMPDEAEVSGLFALMLLHDSRSAARKQDGKMVPLETQDRGQWNTAKIREGQTVIKAALKRKAIGPFQIQAAISALHVEAKDWGSTDWPQIAALYNLLYQLQPSPVVRINHALAVSYAGSIETAIAMLDDIANRADINGYQSYFAARAEQAEWTPIKNLCSVPLH